MPSLPTSSQVHYDRPLTNIVVANLQEVSRFGASKVFPRVPVDKQSDRYYVWDSGDMNRDDAKLRGPGAEAARGVKRLSTDRYACDVFAYAESISDQELANADAPLQLESTAMQTIANKLAIRKEKHWASKAFVGGVWGVTTTPANLWSDYALSDPISDIRTRIFNLLKIPGVTAQGIQLVLGPIVFQYLVDHPKFLNRTQYSGSNTAPALVNEAVIASILGIGGVSVAYASENTTVEVADPTATPPTFDFIHGKSALLLYVAPNPGLMVPSAGYQFAWRGLIGDGEVGVKSYRWEKSATQEMEGEIALDFKIVTKSMGVFFLNAVA